MNRKKKNINKEIPREFFEYQNSSFPAKDLYKANQTKNEQTVNQINDALIDLKNDVIRKTISENENSDKAIDINKNILDFNKQQKGKGLKMFKQMLQRLSIALAQVKAGNTFENLLLEICQITYSFYQAKV